MSVVAETPVSASSRAKAAASFPALSGDDVITPDSCRPGNATADLIAVAPILPVPHTATRSTRTAYLQAVMNLTPGRISGSDTCQLRIWHPGQPLGYLGSGNCSPRLCVEVTERYSSGQLLVGNLATSTQPQVATRRGGTVSHYKSNVRDQVFNLFEVFGVDKALGQGAYADLDADTATEMLGEMVRLAEGPIAESFSDADRNPPVFDPKTHSVALPESFKKSVRALLDGGWDKIGLDEELGGMPMPRALQWALIEHVLGANPAAYMYAMVPGMAQILYNLGTEEQKKWAVLAAERGGTATMVLTEPDAGSDVGAGRTKAVQQPDGSWHLDGVKRFITSGDADDIGENI